MLTLYRRDPDQGWLYREAWYDDAAGEFVVHHGKVGTNGKLVTERAPTEEAESLVAGFSAQCEADGYAEPAAEDLTEVRVVYPLKAADPSASEQRNVNQVHQAVLTALAWRGLGALSDPAPQTEGSPALVMTVPTLHRRKAQETILAAVKSTDVPPAKVDVVSG